MYHILISFVTIHNITQSQRMEQSQRDKTLKLKGESYIKIKLKGELHIKIKLKTN